MKTVTIVIIKEYAITAIHMTEFTGRFSTQMACVSNNVRLAPTLTKTTTARCAMNHALLARMEALKIATPALMGFSSTMDTVSPVKMSMDIILPPKAILARVNK